MDNEQVQSPEGGEAQNWWEGHTEEELGQFFQTDIAKEQFERRLQGELDRGVEAVKRGTKPEKLHPKVQQALREVEGAVERSHRAALEAQRQLAFEQQWESWTPEQKAHYMDQQLLSKKNQEWVNERIQPAARAEAVRLMGQVTTQALSDGVTPEEWQEAVNKLQEAGIDDSTPEGAAELTKRMIEIMRDYQVEKVRDTLEQEIDAKVNKRVEALRAELFGDKMRTGDRPNLTRSVGAGNTTMTPDLARQIFADPDATDAQRAEVRQYLARVRDTGQV